MQTQLSKKNRYQYVTVLVSLYSVSWFACFFLSIHKNGDRCVSTVWIDIYAPIFICNWETIKLQFIIIVNHFAKLHSLHINGTIQYVQTHSNIEIFFVHHSKSNVVLKWIVKIFHIMWVDNKDIIHCTVQCILHSVFDGVSIKINQKMPKIAFQCHLLEELQPLYLNILLAQSRALLSGLVWRFPYGVCSHRYIAGGSKNTIKKSILHHFHITFTKEKQ